MSDWAKWIITAVSPTPREVERLKRPVGDKVMARCAEATSPSYFEVQRFLSRRAAYERQKRRQRFMVGMGVTAVVAASALCVGMVPQWVNLEQPVQIAVVELSPDEEVWVSKAVAFGPAVEMSGDARVVPHTDHTGRWIELLEGELLMSVRSMPEHEPIRIMMDGTILYVTGARFNVSFSSRGVSLVVQEGVVALERDGDRDIVEAGDSRTLPAQVAVVERRPPMVEPAPVVAPRQKAKRPKRPPLKRAETTVDVVETPVLAPASDTDAPEKRESMRAAVAFGALLDIENKVPDTELLADVSEFLGEFPDAAQVPEVEFMRLSALARGSDKSMALGEIEGYLASHNEAMRVVELHAHRANLALALEDCVRAEPSLVVVSERGHGGLKADATLRRGLCAGAAGRDDEAIQLLERGLGMSDADWELLGQADRELKKLKK
jgi:hypothetical protein